VLAQTSKGLVASLNGEVSGGDNISSYTGTSSNRVINLRPLFQSSGSPSVFEMVNPTITRPIVLWGVEQFTPRAGLVLATALTLPARPGRSARTYLMAYAIHAPGF
jgi:hypothetical protein